MLAALGSVWPGARLGVGPRPDLEPEPLRTSFRERASNGSGPLTDTDDALLARIADGDEGAYRALAQRYLAPLLRYASRLLGDTSEAEDVVQETFLRVWQRASDYEARGSKPSTWLYRIAHNRCIDQLRRRRKVDPAALDRHSSGDRPGQRLDRAELASQVQEALTKLPERQRAALVLCHYEGLSNEEAAEVLGCRVHAVESLLARARRSLRETLSQLYDQMKEDVP